MKRILAILLAALLLCCVFVACEEEKEETPNRPSASTTEKVTTEEPTTEEPTTEEVTEAETEFTVSIEDVRQAAITFITPEMIKAAAENPQQDWSDFGGMTVNEDGSVKALFRTGADNRWDPYCYLVKDYVAAGNIAVIQYRCIYNFGVNLYIGSEGNVATGDHEYVPAEIFASKNGEWHYLIVNLADDAMCYNTDDGVLGFLRFGLDMAEPGDTVDFGFVAFFYSVEEAAEVLPIDIDTEDME